jgi:hypothetical protein
MQPSSLKEWNAIKRGLGETCDAIDPIVTTDDAFLP